MQLILASASPRRQQLLAQLGLSFQVQSADIDETPTPNETPAAYVKRLALEKAQAVYTQYPEKDQLAVLGSDTSVIYQGKIFGKPEDETEAKTMLSQLSGQTHQVMTAIALIYQGKPKLDLNISQVSFALLTAADIDAYIATREPFDKAGAYAIQGHAAAFISYLQGSYSGVMGLPLFETKRLLDSCT